MIIIKYYEWIKIMPEERHPIYEIVNSEYDKLRTITRDEAQRLIRDNGLRLVHKNKHGAIYKQ